MKSSLYPFLVVIFNLLGSTCLAQDNPVPEETGVKKFYVRAAFGVLGEANKTAFNDADVTGRTSIRPSTDIVIDDDGVESVKSLFGTLGSGTRFNFLIGYMLNNYLGIELGVNYNKGEEKLLGRYDGPDDLGIDTFSEEFGQLSFLDLAPTIVLSPGFSKLNPYTRVGLSIPVTGKYEVRTSVDKTNIVGLADIFAKGKAEIKGKFSLGFIGALGATYPLTSYLNIFGEAEFKSLHTNGKTVTITEFETKSVFLGQTTLVDGEQLEDRTFSENNYVFTDNYETNTDPNEATKIPSQASNVSSIGFNLGLSFRF